MMRALRMDGDGFAEVDTTVHDLCGMDVTWDAFSLENGHQVWVDDFGLSRADVALATIGSRPHVPLPAYVFGSRGESAVDATMSLDELNGMSRMEGRLRG